MKLVEATNAIEIDLSGEGVQEALVATAERIIRSRLSLDDWNSLSPESQDAFVEAGINIDVSNSVTTAQAAVEMNVKMVEEANKPEKDSLEEARSILNNAVEDTLVNLYKDD